MDLDRLYTLLDKNQGLARLFRDCPEKQKKYLEQVELLQKEIHKLIYPQKNLQTAMPTVLPIVETSAQLPIKDQIFWIESDIRKYRNMILKTDEHYDGVAPSKRVRFYENKIRELQQKLAALKNEKS